MADLIPLTAPCAMANAVIGSIILAEPDQTDSTAPESNGTLVHFLHTHWHRRFFYLIRKLLSVASSVDSFVAGVDTDTDQGQVRQ